MVIECPTCPVSREEYMLLMNGKGLMIKARGRAEGVGLTERLAGKRRRVLQPTLSRTPYRKLGHSHGLFIHCSDVFSCNYLPSSTPSNLNNHVS
jgi:hypothetical protein